MNRRAFLGSIGSAGLLNVPAAAQPAPPVKPTPLSPLNVTDRAQLFVERTVVDHYDKVSFTLHPARKHPGNPLLKKDKPWETWRVRVYGSVIWDEAEKIFKMWYFGGYPEYFTEVGSYTLYATSPDGVHWEKPLVGTFPMRNGGRHNAVMRAMIANVAKDSFDSDPAKRYKTVCWYKSPEDISAYHSMVSADGLQWALHSRRPVAPGGDVINGYYDEDRRLYVAFPKTHGVSVREMKRRCFNLITSSDFETWTEPRLVLVPDQRDDAGTLRRLEEVRWLLENPDDPSLVRTEFYGLGAYTAESCTIAFPWIFSINNNSRSSNFRNQDGIIEVQLAASRDLLNWERHFRTPCISRGARGEWDSGIFHTVSRAIRVRDEIRLYYSCGNFSHAAKVLPTPDNLAEKSDRWSAIGLATWPLDRFVSVDGPAEGGSVTTVPLVFSGNQLHVNARNRPGGRLKAELLDAAGRSLPGVPPSDTFRGDGLREIIKWNGRADLSQWKGKPVCLRFQLKNCELYSFAFRSSKA